MRVLIELLDRDPLENVLASCIFRPDEVVFLCDTRDATFFKESAIYRLLRRRKLKTQPRFYYFDASDPVGISRVLGAVVRDHPGCVFDFSGGPDLALLVAGAVFAEMRLPAFYIDIARGRFISLRGCESLAEQFAIPSFTAEDVFAMTGAAVHGYGHFSQNAINAAFEQDVLAAFAVVQRNAKAWGGFVSWLQGLCAGTPAGQLEVTGPRRSRGGRYAANPVLLGHLEDAGLLRRVSFEKNLVTITFKSPLIRRCLLIEGVWLELYCYVTARRAGSFNDVRTSMIVDWDGANGGAANARNEVDVFLVKGVTPVFISCKMSLPSALSMSEIRLLATKFGGRHSRAVMLTAARFGEEHRALKARAADLELCLIDGETLARGTLVEELERIAAPLPEPETRLVGHRMWPLGDG